MTIVYPQYRAIVAKVGTDVLLTAEHTLDRERIHHIIEQIMRIKHDLRMRKFLLVTSGAVAAGLAAYGRKRSPQRLTLVEKQKYASAGNELYELIRQTLAQHSCVANVMQVTRKNFRDIVERENLLNAIGSIIEDEVDGLVVMNENDVVATEELDYSFGDNDRLAEEAVLLTGADVLANLTSTNGIQKDLSDPTSTIEIYTEDCDQYIRKDIKSENSSGGAETKVGVGKRLQRRGVTTHIMNGKIDGILSHVLLGGERGDGMNWTTFHPDA